MSDANDSTIKRVIVNTGLMQKGGRKTRRVTKGGATEAQEDGTIVVQKEEIKLLPPPTNPLLLTAPPKASTPAATAPVPAAAVAAPLVGGAKKVILSKTKKVTKVILGSPKLIPHHKRHKTLKHFKVSTGGLGVRLRRAKTIKKHADATSLEGIKKELVAASLIKADTKAPESVLRQIYTDFMVLKKKAL
jgi:hypothetical protein